MRMTGNTKKQRTTIQDWDKKAELYGTLIYKDSKWGWRKYDGII